MRRKVSKSPRLYDINPAKYPGKNTQVIRYPTIVDTPTLIRPGIMNEWFSRYLPIFVVPERSKLTVAISDG